GGTGEQRASQQCEGRPDLCAWSRVSGPRPHDPSVPSPKFVAKVSEQSAVLARRADAGISGILRGGATRPGRLRVAEFGDELRGRDTSARVVPGRCAWGCWGS